MPFQKGHKLGFQKGHKGFVKKKPINQLIDMICGEGCEAQVRFLNDVSNGTVRNPANPEEFLHIPINWRTDAAKWLLERRHGKATQTLDVTSHEGEPQTIDYTRFTDAQLAEIERLHELGRVVDAEFTEGVESPALPEGEKK